VNKSYKIVINIGWLVVDNIFRLFSGLFIGVWIARHLGPEKYGLLGYATAFSSIFTTIATLGLQSVVVRDLLKSKNDANEIIGTTVVLKIFGGLFSYIIMIMTAVILFDGAKQKETVVILVGIGVLFRFSDGLIYFFESNLESKLIVLIQNIGFIVFALVKVGLIINDAPLWLFAVVIAVEQLVVTVFVVWCYNFKGYAVRGLRWSKVRAQNLILNCWPLLISSIFVTVFMKIDVLMLSHIKGDDAAGVYSAASKISEIFYFIPVAIVKSMAPYIVEAKETGGEYYANVIQGLYGGLVWLGISISVLLTLSSEMIVSRVFGVQYSGASAVVAVHVWGLVFVFVGVASSQWILVENLQILSLQRTVLGAAINIAINYAYINNYGAIASAWATVISFAFTSVLFDLVNKKTRPQFVVKIKALNPINTVNSIKFCIYE